MKHFSILMFIAIIILSCNSKSESKENPTEKSKSIEQKIGKKFFDYDEIDYYSTDFDEEKVGELFDNQTKSEIDSLKFGVILDEIPKSISDLYFIDKLKEIGYHKSIINKSKFKEIDKIFVEKTVDESLATSCIYVYRDILVFKKKNKIVGIAKICFNCWANEIYGTTANTSNFGQNGDYEILEKILRE